MPTVSTTIMKQVKLQPALRLKLSKEFRLYGQLKSQLDAITQAMDKSKAVIASIREQSGEASLSLDGYKTTLISPIRSKFNPKKFVADGGDLSIYNNAVESVPSKSYEKITLPGQKELPLDE